MKAGYWLAYLSAAMLAANVSAQAITKHSYRIVDDPEKGVRRRIDTEEVQTDFLIGSATAVTTDIHEEPLPKPTLFDQSTAYPFNAPKCKSITKVPANQDGVYTSEDCKTAFVMPDIKGKMTVTNLSTSPTMQLCNALYTAQDTEASIDATILKLTKVVENLDPTDPKASIITERITKLQDAIPKLYTIFENVVAGNAQVIFSTSDEQTRLKDFMWENADAVKNESLQIQPVPIQESYISFTPAKDLKRPRILDFSLSGVKPTSKSVGQLDQNIYRSGLNATGSLTLSLWGLCPGRDNKPIDKSKIVLNVSPVITYVVPLLAWAGYHAELNNSQAISNIMNIAKTHGQFSNTDIEKYSLSGSAESGFTFNIINTGLKSVYNADDQSGFFTNLREQVFQKLNAHLLDQMVKSGLVQLAETPNNGIDAPPAGTRDEVRQGPDSCSSSWFGLSHSCSPTFYTVKIPVTSTGDSVIEKYPDVQFKNVDEVQVREPITSVHTIIFDAPEASPTNSNSAN